MEVDHGNGVEHVAGNDPSVGHHHPELCAARGYAVQGVGDGQSQLDGCRLHRARNELAAPAPALVGSADHERHVVPGVNQRMERLYRGRRRAQIDESGHW